ncbi:MAG: 16S rRNA (adenine(1518)-N(6)/adenine(1519)-N(6))-dimethyltransferase [Thermodesulfovibrionales bacterium]|nr:16S rRNA (adenine(1518)-N(6)/adenine(1519)-N(6))-dimethyltransferase [Thermodesulfovibrionales bacterium]
MAKKRLGQHFLSDPSILKRIVGTARLEPEDLVVEIGPGPGRLTRILAGAVRRVIAIELDEALYRALRDEYAQEENVEVVYGDALEYPYEDLPEFKVVANIPYYITTPIIFRLLEKKSAHLNMLKGVQGIPPLEKEGMPDFRTNRLKSMTLTIQKEVAERIVARPGGKDYGVLSIMVQYLGDPELKFIIPKQAFRPVPKVDSAVIYIRIREHPAVNVRDEEQFFRIVRTAFSQRRKMLSNSLKSFGGDVKEWLDRAEIEGVRRPETLSIGDFVRLADTFEIS